MIQQKYLLPLSCDKLFEPEQLALIGLLSHYTEYSLW